MKVTRNPGMILLAIWLIVHGLARLLNFAVPPSLLPILAIVAGAVILFVDAGFHVGLAKNLGMIVLGLWLIVHGLVSIVTVNVTGINYIVSLLALLAGLLILLLDESRRVKLTGNAARFLLGIFLVFHGLTNLLGLAGPGYRVAWAILTLIAGVAVLLFDRGSSAA